jgi:hypothetical protein
MLDAADDPHRAPMPEKGRLAGWTTRIGTVCRAAAREHSLLAALVALHVLAAWLMPVFLGRRLVFQVSLGSIAMLLAMIGLWAMLIALVVDFVIATARNPRGRPFATLRQRIVRHHLRAERIVGGLIVMALLPPFVSSFTFLQASAPLIHKLDWDPALAAFERWMHFGRYPWEWLQPLLGYPFVSSLLSSVYASWFFLLYGMLIWQAFSLRDPVLRMQFLLCSVLIWMVLGNVFGTLFGSGGPVYYGRITGLDDPFAPLMAYLHAAGLEWPNVSLAVQETLWRAYLVNGDHDRVNGAVMAMPSLHVATAFSFLLIGRSINRWLSLALGLYVLLLLIATVHLGWHYAIDGYAGILGTWLIWWACGRVLRWPAVNLWLWGRQPADRPDAAA